VRVIAAREANLTKAQAVGVALEGSNDVAAFERAWQRVEADRARLRSVDVTVFADEESAIAALQNIAGILSATAWVDGLKAEARVDTFDGLRATIPAKGL